MPFGPFGQGAYGDGTDPFPGSISNFSARPGLQGPQVVLTWTNPEFAPRGVMLRRKLGEAPRDIEDGVLVFERTLNEVMPEGFADIAEDLLPIEAESGDGRWWYYRAFVKPADLALSDQDGGSIVEEIEDTDFSTPQDVQGYSAFSVFVENTSEVDPANAFISVAPELTGPWMEIGSIILGAAESGRFEVVDSHKYVRTQIVGADARVSVIRVLPDEWLTYDALTAPVYVFKTGRHMAFVRKYGLPEFYFEADAGQLQVALTETETADYEYFNLGLTGMDYGPLQRFLMVYLAELDRIEAYLGSIFQYSADIDEMPPQEFAHVAALLGYDLEVTGRPEFDVRAEIFRIAGVWKSKGTSALLAATGNQIFGFLPRVQEGPGRVFRVANPDLYANLLGE